MSSVYQDILSALLTQIQGLTLSGIANSNIVIRKLPTFQDQIDSLPLIVISPTEESQLVTRISFEGVSVSYPIQITIITANNANQSPTQLFQYLEWQQQIRRLLQPPLLSGVSAVWDSDVTLQWVLKRDLVNKQYDFQTLLLKFDAQEPTSDS